MSIACSELVAPRFRPEVELLLCCARTEMDGERTARIRVILEGEIDWDYLFRTARRHGLLPLLYTHLNTICPEALPEAGLDRLCDYFRRNTVRNSFLTGELVKLLKLFEGQGISAVPYKGPALAYQVYGNLALRVFGDLDILIRKRDVAGAKSILLSQGYRPELQLTDDQEKAFSRFECDQHFTLEGSSIPVELHWDVTPPYFSFPLEPDDLWDRLEDLYLLGTKIQTVALSDLILISCVHGAKHLWERLEWIVGVAETARLSTHKQWERAAKQARELRSERMFHLGLFLAHDLLEAPIPDEVLRKVDAGREVKSLARRVCEGLFQEDKKSPGLFGRALFHLGARECALDKIRYCFRRSMTPTFKDWELLPLPASLSPLYYLLRPVRLAGEFGISPFKRLL